MATMTNTRTYSQFIFIPASIGMMMITLLASCASNPKSAKAVSGLKDLREELTDGDKQIDNVLASVNALSNAGGNLKPAVDDLEDQIKATEKQSRIIRDRYTDMRERAAEYQTNWRDDAQAYDSPELRQAADARADRVRAHYDHIADLGREARDAYGPLIKNLKELHSYMENDMTPASLQAAQPMIDKVNANGATLKQR